MTHAATQPGPSADESLAARHGWGPARCGYRANRVMLWIGLHFLPLAYVLIGFATLYFFVAAPKARQASMAYLDRIHKRRRGMLRRWWQTCRHLFEFGVLLLDRALMLTTPHHGFAVSCDGLVHLRQALDEHRGLLLFTAHFGTAEAAAPYLAKMALTRPIHLVMYQDAADSTEQFHRAHRHRLKDMHIISTTDPLMAGLKIMRALQSGDIVAIRADRTLAGRSIPATLLGEAVELPAGPFLAAALTDAPVLHIYTCRLAYRRYICMISPGHSYGDQRLGTREERMARAAADYAARLEKMLREHPYQWSNFYDFWRTNSPTEEPDPTAAKPAGDAHR